MAIVQSDGVLTQAHQEWAPAYLPSGLTLSDGLSVDYAAIFATQPNLRTTISFLARNIADLGWKLFERVSDTERQSLSDHEMADVLQRPNPRTTAFRYKASIMYDLGIYDRHYSLKQRNKVTGRLNLIRVPPYMMRPAGENWLFPEQFEFLGNKGSKFFDADEVFHLHGHDPRNPADGLSPIETLRQIINEDIQASRYREQLWRNGARPSGIVRRPRNAPWSPEARKRFQEDFRAQFSGSGTETGGVALLEDDMEFMQTAFSARESEYLGARRLTREEIAAAYHVSPLFVGILENANFSNVKEQHKHLYQDTLGPWCTMIEEDMALQVLSEFPDLDRRAYVEFNIAEKLRGSFEERAAVTQTAVGRPWVTVNEARSQDNLPPIDGGDGLVTPLNVLVGGQASPRDSAPPITASRKALTKAVEDLPEDVQGWQAKHVEVLTAFFERQKSSILSKLGAGQALSSAWDTERWNDELRDALAGLSMEMTTEIASAVAESFGGEYDSALSEAWLLESARIASEGINSATYSQIESSEDPPVDAARHTFEVAAGSRAAQISVTRASAIGNFAKVQGADQAGVRKKRWRVRSSNSRHSYMDGETVGIREDFSIGGPWPGGPGIREDQAAGCVCAVEFIGGDS